MKIGALITKNARAKWSCAWGLICLFHLCASVPSFAQTGAALGAPAVGRIVFDAMEGSNDDIYIIDDNGKNMRRLTTDPERDQEPAISPDGSRVAFISYRDGNGEVFIMNVDGSHQVRLTINPAGDRNPTFSRDGRKIVFTRIFPSPSPKEPRHGIYSMNLDGSKLKKVADAGAASGIARDATFGGPNGDKMAFITIDGLFAANADGSDEKAIAGQSSIEPAISPDGEKVAYVRSRTENSRLFSEINIVNADGTNDVPLTNTARNANEPTWSPDGSRIAFASNAFGMWNIYSFKPDGSDAKQITDYHELCFSPSWGVKYEGAMPPPITPRITPNPWSKYFAAVRAEKVE